MLIVSAAGRRRAGCERNHWVKGFEEAFEDVGDRFGWRDGG